MALLSFFLFSAKCRPPQNPFVESHVQKLPTRGGAVRAEWSQWSQVSRLQGFPRWCVIWKMSPLQHSKYCEVVSCSKGISFHWSLWEEQAVKLTVFYPWTKRPQTQKERIVFQVFFRSYVQLRGVVWVFSNRVAHIFQMVAKNHYII